jgi:hypothetical protein
MRPRRLDVVPYHVASSYEASFMNTSEYRQPLSPTPLVERPAKGATVRWLGTVIATTCLVLAACGKSPDAGTNKTAAADSKATDAKPADTKAADSDAKAPADEADSAKEKEGVTLTQEQVETLGVTSQPAEAIEYRAETVGYGVVLEHQAIAQVVADVQTAQAAAQFSKASLERTRGLHGTPGAMSADLEQTAEQKAAVDTAALTLSSEKLSTTWGMKPPWKDNIHDARVKSLAHGDMQLIRVTFPLGTLPGAPDVLHGSSVGSIRQEATATMRPVWTAPADINIPGRSFFTLLPAGTTAEGERLQVWAPTGQPTPGAMIPVAAIVLNASKYWCYVESKPGTFTRVEVDTSRPTGGGYVVTEGVKPGDKVVVTAVEQLLAKESGSSEEPD